MINIKTNVRKWGKWATRRYYEKRGMYGSAILVRLF